PAAVRLTPRMGPKGFKADGADLAMVDVEVVDAAGNRCPVALNMIDFSLAGPAEWRGGIAQGPDNYILSKSLPVENGVNRVLLRSTTEAGKVVVTATSAGLKPASVELVSRPVKVADGLSHEMPGDGLPSFEGRGPTPRGDSVTVTRRAVQIASATAGANADKAATSFDDNEVTSWSNDGRRATAWIRYELARPAKVSEVTLKLGNWRARSYPVRVTVDDKVVYTGVTPQSLGYVTITFAPVTGRSLRIELTAAAAERDAFGQVTELADPQNAETTGGKGDAKGSLDIVEIEIYEPVARGARR
ncbi:MAG TPA: discoidin domain-containing protein, partial [Pyrinomonadaceae bacterium]